MTEYETVLDTGQAAPHVVEGVIDHVLPYPPDADPVTSPYWSVLFRLGAQPAPDSAVQGELIISRATHRGVDWTRGFKFLRFSCQEWPAPDPLSGRCTLGEQQLGRLELGLGDVWHAFYRSGAPVTTWVEGVAQEYAWNYRDRVEDLNIVNDTQVYLYGQMNRESSPQDPRIPDLRSLEGRTVRFGFSQPPVPSEYPVRNAGQRAALIAGEVAQVDWGTPDPYRAGWIHFTNVAPILDSLVLPEGVSAITGVPTQMNAALLSGQVDIANISAVEFIRNADVLEALPDFSVAVLGPVYSVNLFHTRPLEELRRVALTAQSAMSVALLEVLLRERGLSPVLERAEGEAESLLAQGFDGVLRIGDSALREWYGVVGPLTPETTMTSLPHSARGITVTDLAEEWFRLTGHPFTFAVWAYRKDRPPPLALVRAMREARRDGIGHLADVAARHARKLGLPERVVQHYLWNFRYHLEAPDRLGLHEFAAKAVPGHAPLTFGPRPGQE
ncbi:hypothetical protein GCM10008959_36930 [Deinococcus seoulensis]|uniref:Chorismate dehydratase n=1 Tax=Deinococcus seoulensis TaxID=1837379 RepID=A0ABQ2RW69_9DEIO|nr:hypothetical protein GCM10008959_36930 [Deinococcus seoulensis]